MFIVADQLLVHAVGDYMFQSDWQAILKLQSWKPAFWHALTYTLCFLVLTRSPLALAFIFATHILIDRYRLARYVCWAKNFLAPRWIPLYSKSWLCGGCTHSSVFESTTEKIIPACPKCKDTSKMLLLSENPITMLRNYPWSECSKTGYHESRPPFLSVWLLIIVDNAMHVLCNGIALKWLA